MSADALLIAVEIFLKKIFKNYEWICFKLPTLIDDVPWYGTERGLLGFSRTFANKSTTCSSMDIACTTLVCEMI
jgi:hypothetical protein